MSSMVAEQETQTLGAFIAKEGILARAEQVDQNPNMEEDAWSRSARHFKVTLWRKTGDQRRRLTTYFSQGSAHTKDPTAEDVLSCLGDDAASVENSGSFEDWASDLGFDTDSRKAERSYNQCLGQTEKLKRFLGEEAYSVLLWETERG